MFGYLYSSEKEVKKDLMTQIAKLQAVPGWADKLASTGVASAAEFRTEVADIERKMDGANIMNLRYWRDTLAKIVSGLDATPAPTPAPKPVPKPEPKEELPPVPPGITCPHYSKASAFPKNWNDPAAEKRYLKAHPDVKNWVAVMAKRFKGKGLNALWHYRCYGQKEGRTWAGWELGNIPGYLR